MSYAQVADLEARGAPEGDSDPRAAPGTVTRREAVRGIARRARHDAVRVTGHVGPCG